MEPKNGYQQLIAQDKLAARLPELERLNAEKATEVITDIVVNCPCLELNNLLSRTQSASSSSSFMNKLRRAVELRTHIENLEKEPEKFLIILQDIHLADELSALLKQSVDQININKAVVEAVKHQFNLIGKNLRYAAHLLHGTDFLTKLQQAYNLRRQLEQLSGDTPEKFFTSRDYSEEVISFFPELVDYCLDEHSKKIGRLLQQKQQLDVNPLIKERLQSLSDRWPKSAFAKIYETMHAPFNAIRPSIMGLLRPGVKSGSNTELHEPQELQKPENELESDSNTLAC